MYWDEKVKAVKGIGEKTEKLLGKLGIETVGQLVTHFPRDYDSYTGITDIGRIVPGTDVVVEGSIVSRPTIKKHRQLTIVNAVLKDSTGSVLLTWFNMPYMARTIKTGVYYIMRGKVALKQGRLVIEQPVIYSKQEYYSGLNVLLPVYRLTSGVTNNSMRKYIQLALRDTKFEQDYLPAAYCRENSLYRREKAIKHVHFPDSRDDAIKAGKRIAYDEFFLFLLALKCLKGQSDSKECRDSYVDTGICDRLINSLPYSLTNAQLRVWNDMKKDMMSGYIMTRLVQGDVGSGKTVLALLALLFNYDNGYQGSIMAPTEVLALQHYEYFSSVLEEYGVKVGLLTGSTTAANKRKMYARIENGEIDIIVGTHALIQEKVHYRNLGLVITDEQHRFGVNQRIQLSQKGDKCHSVVMSATPIPRTLAMIIYGDMDISVVDEIPAGRPPKKNCVVGTNFRDAAYKLMIQEVNSGNQVYIICPMVEDGDNVNLESVEGYTVKLKSVMPDNIRIAALHGKMPAAKKSEIISLFSKGEIDILVSTTVIEVGINVLSATVIMVENSERFGLAQLHQLRGRVGRGNRQSYCIFMHGDTGKDNIKRLEILNNSNDGFYIASEDLRLRGPGDMFGFRQSGEMSFKYADIYSDADMLMLANERVKGMSVDEVHEFFEQNPQFAFGNFENGENVGL